MKIDKKYYLDGTEKVGDKVWSLEKFLKDLDGSSKISEIDETLYCVRVDKHYYYTKEGVIKNSNRLPSLFKSNPFIPEFPKMMEVSDNQKKWMRLTVYGIKYNDNAPFITDAGHYMYAREIQTKPKLSEILKEKGIDINQFENDL